MRLSGIAVLIIPSWGLEQLRGRYEFRLLSEHLAQVGIPSLRWDPPGTANGIVSSGDIQMDYLERIGTCLQDAVSHLQSMAGVHDVVIVGHRLGALTIASCAEKLSDQGICQIVLWDPCVSGRKFLRELQLRESTRFSEGFSKHLVGNTSIFEADGYKLDGQMLLAIKEMQLVEATHLSNVDIVIPAVSKDLESIIKVWSERQNTQFANLTIIDDAGIDISKWEGPSQCTKTISFIEQTVLKRNETFQSSDDTAAPNTMDLNNSVRFVHHETSVELVEQTLSSGANNELFGIVTTAVFIESAPCAVLLLGTAAEACAGRGDSNAHLARSLASKGIQTIRMDFRGVGESALMSDKCDNLAYGVDRQNDVVEMASVLRKLSNEKVVVLGICTGAFFGIHAAASGAADRVIAVNPQLYWSGEFPTDWSAIDSEVAGDRLTKAISSGVRWKKLFSGAYNYETIAAGVKAILRRVHEECIPSAAQQSDFGVGIPRLDLLKLFNSDTEFDLIFSRDDLGYAHLIAHGPRAMRQLTKSGKVRLHIMDRADHTFSTVGQRKRLDEKILELLLENR